MDASLRVVAASAPLRVSVKPAKPSDAATRSPDGVATIQTAPGTSRPQAADRYSQNPQLGPDCATPQPQHLRVGPVAGSEQRQPQ